MTAALATEVEFAGRLRIAAGRIARSGLGQKPVDGMTPSRMTALAVLAAEQPLRMGELAARLGISAPTVSRLVDHLAELGFLERVADEDDHRATRVCLSPAGRDGLAAVREHGACWPSGSPRSTMPSAPCWSARCPCWSGSLDLKSS
jgi:DNA-binding MarR family transcriptional regulator